MNQNEKPGWLASEGGKDLLTAIGILLFALGGFFFINPNGASIWPGPGGMSWRTMPFIYSTLLAALALIYIVQSVRRMRREMALPDLPFDAEKQAEDRVILFRRVVTFCLLMVYVSLLRVFGFALMTPLFLFCLFRLFGRGAWRGDMVISLIGSLVLWVLFVRVLHLNLKGYTWDPVTPFLLDLLKTVGL